MRRTQPNEVVQASSVERRACGAGGDYDVGSDPVQGGERARRTHVVRDMGRGGGGHVEYQPNFGARRKSRRTGPQRRMLWGVGEAAMPATPLRFDNTAPIVRRHDAGTCVERRKLGAVWRRALWIVELELISPRSNVEPGEGRMPAL